MAVVKEYIYDTYTVKINDQYINDSEEFREGVIQRISEILSNAFMKNPEIFMKEEHDTRLDL